jgi:ribosomal-protein-alanine N-acetyltransferase
MREIRLLCAADLPGVAEIESLCFKEPWSQKALELLLEGANFGVAALEDGEVAAYVGVISIAPEGEITNVATHPRFRRRGIAKEVLEFLKSEAKRRGIDSLYLEVRRSNEAARALYENAGFTVIGERRGFYKNPKEDAVLMKFSLPA